jgi:hypothetical protein
MKNLISAAPWLALSLAVRPVTGADNLIQNGGFEEPKITGRVSAQQGGSPASSGVKTTWSHFQSMERTGKVTVGLTSEIARGGRQSVYVQFEKAQKTRGAFLMSDLIPIKALENYRVSLWGRTDGKRPLTLDQGRPFQILEVEFYPADQASRIGETESRTQMIPGMAERLLFTSSKWSEYYAEFKAPKNAEFMKVTFKWESPRHETPATGVIFFDDAAVEGVPGTLVPTLDPPVPSTAPVVPDGKVESSTEGATSPAAPANPQGK